MAMKSKNPGIFSLERVLTFHKRIGGSVLIYGLYL